MKRKLKPIQLVLVICILAALTLTACGGDTAAPVAEEETEAKKVALLLPGVSYDESWSQSGYEGLLKAQEDCGIEPAYTENVEQAEQIEVFRNYAQQGYDIIVGHGGQYTDAAETVAAEFPEIEFVVTNSMTAHDNLSAVSCSYMQMGYLAGVLGCHMTETNHIAAIQGERLHIMDPVYVAYPMGANSCKDEEVKVDIPVVGSWGDVSKAREVSLALIADGADVLWSNLNEEIAGMFSAAEDQGVYTIGLYDDMREASPETVLASAVFYPDKQVYQAACGFVTDGEIHFLTMDDPDATDLIMTDLVPEDVKAAVEQAKQDIIDGKVTFPDLSDLPTEYDPNFWKEYMPE